MGKHRRLRGAGLFILAAAASLLFHITALAEGWQKVGENWKYVRPDGGYIVSDWAQDEDGRWYYLDSSGNRMRDGVTPDGYTLDKNGVWIEDVEQVIRYPHIRPDASCNFYAGKNAEPIFGVQADETRKGKIAFSFDSAYVNAYCVPILDILDKYDIKSTFFMTGEWVDANPELVKEIVKRGHELGNHSISHPSFPKLSRAQMEAQVRETHDKVKELTGFDMFLFRFPYGDYSNASLDALKDMGYYCIQWTVDTQDWRDDSPEAILNRVYKSPNVKEGSIVLMHNGAKYTPQILETIIQYAQGKELDIVPVSQLIYTRNFKMNVMGTQIPVFE